jgi:hypothetical protein
VAVYARKNIIIDTTHPIPRRYELFNVILYLTKPVDTDMNIHCYVFALLLFSLPACTHVKTDSNISSNSSKDAQMNNTNQSDRSSDLKPNLNAEQALQGVLMLIRNHKQVSEFTPERLSQIFHTSVPYANDDPNRYGFGESLSSDWSYNFDVNKKTRDLEGKEWSKFNFTFTPNNPDAYPNINSICAMNFDKFTAELESMGFKREHYYGEHGRWIYDEFSNTAMRINVYLEGEAQADINADKRPRACVKMIEIW